MRLTTGISWYQDQMSVFGLLAMVRTAAGGGGRCSRLKRGGGSEF